MAESDPQKQVTALREEIDKLRAELAARTAETYEGMRERAGKTGQSVRAAAREGADYVRSEGAAVADTARAHPAATSALVLTVGFAGLILGYLLASATEPAPRRYWR
ncbi:hypothetical protein [Mycoplana dimorpha]|uniref:ElaB/YqjD/DUF883 family membrane-anchored ribosome-binding protein n=1 Tax=Mycoplana dimorpha TaxID=28320 RepID=A0A2T5BEC8_MYCDI|nr:hypothetical protein [Mycoplana dimorpha]PTM97354.1 hypothetical protein C7449_102224 [Mycoplana dimorpha]